VICPSEADVPAKRVTVGGVPFDALTEDRVVDHVRAALGRGQGGRILTPNVDVMRQINRNPAARDALDDSTLVVADGMPVIWASRLAGTPLPQRVSGADLIWSLSRGLGRDGRSVFVLGGQPATTSNLSAGTRSSATEPRWPDEPELPHDWPNELARTDLDHPDELDWWNEPQDPFDTHALNGLTRSDEWDWNANPVVRRTAAHRAPDEESSAELEERVRTGRHSANTYRDAGSHRDVDHADGNAYQQVRVPVSRRNVGPSHRADSPRPSRNESAPFQRADIDGAGRAAAALRNECPGLHVVGAVSPPFGFDRDPDAFARVRDEIVAARPDLVLVGIGFPRQERLIAALRMHLPEAWFLGCGMAIGFVAGEHRRAPEWMRRAGMEWMHRLGSEPRRLAERYLRHDLPFAVSLLARTVISRYRNRPTAGRHSR
jgi:exopolysaccharide biosynthesis WecB/TagA/CpsF family protein